MNCGSGLVSLSLYLLVFPADPGPGVFHLLTPAGIQLLQTGISRTSGSERSPFENVQVHILDREDHYFEQGMKEAVYTKLGRSSLNRGGGSRLIFHQPSMKSFLRVSIVCTWTCVSLTHTHMNVGGSNNPQVTIRGTLTYQLKLKPFE